MEYAALVSGGVDSAVALHTIAARADGPVRAYYLKIWLEDELSFLGECPWEEDLQYARDVCAAARVPLEVVPLQDQYYERVVSYTLAELKAGHTPSPDIFCNQRIKFGAFYDAIGGSADRIVTGHYARVLRPGGDGGIGGDREVGGDGGVGGSGAGVAPVRLGMAPDAVKDQTYFLSHLSQEQLSRSEFPLGEMTKSQVRARANKLELSNRDRPDSQGICFLGRIKYTDFVRHYLGDREGPITNADTGEELGRHRGAWFYTIGQRQGLGLGNGPWYVVRRDIERNVVEVSHAMRVAQRARRRFMVGNLHWIAGPPAEAVASGGRLMLKLRHGPERTACTLEVPGGGALDGARELAVTMEQADRGVAPGQFAVFYHGEICLGAGMIIDAPEEQERWK
ncbi:MAG: tRNA 2-thiouridine(34) synthase MnmA [Alkalispirochaeta sp.]